MTVYYQAHSSREINRRYLESKCPNIMKDMITVAYWNIRHTDLYKDIVNPLLLTNQTTRFWAICSFFYCNVEWTAVDWILLEFASWSGKVSQKYVYIHLMCWTARYSHRWITFFISFSPISPLFSFMVRIYVYIYLKTQATSLIHPFLLLLCALYLLKTFRIICGA